MESDRVFERPHLVLIEPRTSHADDVHLLAGRVSAHHRQHGGPIQLVVHVDTDTPVPSDDARVAIREMTREVRPYATIHIVISQDGFRGSVFRSIAATLVMLAPAGYSIRVRSDLRQVLREVAEQLATPDDLLWAEYSSWNGQGAPLVASS